MAHWQSVDGTRSSVLALNQLANILRMGRGSTTCSRPRCATWTGRPRQRCSAGSMFTAGDGCHPRGSAIGCGWCSASPDWRCSRAAHHGPWWALDDWHPRCDPRIPLCAREPQANYGCSPGQITLPWLREAVKWHLGTQLEAGTLRWTTVSQERHKCLQRFDNWLTTAFDDARGVLGDPSAAAEQAAAFRHWTADPANRMTRENDRRHYTKPVHPRQINDDIRAVAELFAFVAANQGQARAIFGRSPWQRVTETHAAGWFRQVSRIPHSRP